MGIFIIAMGLPLTSYLSFLIIDDIEFVYPLSSSIEKERRHQVVSAPIILWECS